jgi:hypothetical protein
MGFLLSWRPGGRFSHPVGMENPPPAYFPTLAVPIWQIIQSKRTEILSILPVLPTHNESS